MNDTVISLRRQAAAAVALHKAEPIAGEAIGVLAKSGDIATVKAALVIVCISFVKMLAAHHSTTQAEEWRQMQEFVACMLDCED